MGDLQQDAEVQEVLTIRFMGSLAGTYQPPVTSSTSSVTAVEEIPGGDSGEATTSTDPRGIVSLTDSDLAGETLATIAAFSTGVPTTDTDQLTAYTQDGNGDTLTQTAVEPSGTPNEITGYQYGVGGTAGTNLFSNDLLAKTLFPDPGTGYASTSYEQVYGYSLQGDTLSFEDQNGTIHQYTLDRVGRDTADAVTTLGSGVDGTVRRLVYSFNDAGLPFEQSSYSAASGGSLVNLEEDVYNGLQQLTTQTQLVTATIGGSVQYNYNLMADGQNNSKLDSIVYPDGRIVDYDYSLNQEPVTGIAVSGTTATVTTAVADGLSTGATVTIAGASHAALDGTFTITVTGSTTFTYTFSGSAAADSSSDITETPVSLDSTISRPDGLQDHAGSTAGTVLQSYLYLGLGTIVQENDGNGTALSYIQQSPAPTPTPTTIDSAGDRYTGLDRFGRIVYQNWFNTSTLAQTQGDQYGYDNDSDVLFDNVVGQGSTAASYSQLYHASSTAGGDNNGAYDPLGREETFIRGTLSASGNNTYSSAPLDTISNANINTVSGSDDTYALDALGNWSSSASGAGTGTSTAPTLSSTSRTNNSQNESTGVGSNTLTFDRDGNTLTDQAGNTYTYDAWDRPIDASAGSIVYSYLPDSAQAIRAACPGGTSDSYYSTDMQVLEEDTPSSCTGGGCCGGCGGCGGCTAPTVDSQYVWGLAYVNEMVERDDDSTGGSLGISGSGLGERIYPEQDANFNVRTLTSNSGTVLEHIDYDDYGNARILSSAYATTVTAFGSDTYNWVYGFQGGRYDPATGLYRFGARDYSPNLGRWMEQDPGGYVDGANKYQFTGGSCADHRDPSGMDFIAVADRAVHDSVGLFYHYSLELWKTACQDDRYPSPNTNEYDWSRLTKGAGKLGSVELLKRTWHSDILRGIHTNVSVIYYNEDEGTNLAVIAHGDPSLVKEKWDEIIGFAKTYGYAEQSDATRAVHWPDSHYEISLDGNNSNTFVRTIVSDVRLPMVDLPGWHPGALTPHKIGYWPDHVTSDPFPPTVGSM